MHLLLGQIQDFKRNEIRMDVHTSNVGGPSYAVPH